MHQEHFYFMVKTEEEGSELSSQPLKEHRTHTGFDYKCDNDDSQKGGFWVPIYSLVFN